MDKKEVKALLKKYNQELGESSIHQYISEIYRYEKNDLMKSLIKEVIYLDKYYLTFIMDKYISESTYFRLRNQLIDKIYHLLILDNKVTREEILND